MAFTSTSDLEELTPTEAVQMYLADKQSDSAEATVRSHKSRLGHFLDWCNENGIEKYEGFRALYNNDKLARPFMLKKCSAKR